MKTMRRIAVVAVVGGTVTMLAAPAYAAHNHFVLLPNGRCQQVAQGQTRISDPAHGGFHRFHHAVHLGATESTAAPDTLGDGNAAVNVYKDACPSR